MITQASRWHRWRFAVAALVLTPAFIWFWGLDESVERQAAAVALGTLAFGNSVEAFVEFRLWWAIRNQRDQTPVGRLLKSKMLALASKHLSRVFIDILFLFAAIEPGLRIFPFHLRMVLYVVCAAATLVAAGYGWLLLDRVEKEEELLVRQADMKAREARLDRTAHKQAVTGEMQAEVGLVQAETERELTKRGHTMTKRGATMDDKGAGQDAHEADLVSREAALVRVGDRVVPIPVALEKVIEAIEQVVEDVPEIKQDVKDVRKRIVDGETP